jgi:hypothetical protein
MPAPYANMFNVRCWQRNPRKGTAQPEFLCHRFPIKGGLNLREVMAAQMSRPNPFLRLVRLATERNEIMDDLLFVPVQHGPYVYELEMGDETKIEKAIKPPTPRGRDGMSFTYLSHEQFEAIWPSFDRKKLDD